MAHTREGIGRFAAILADLDGTLVETMPLQHLAYARTFARYGGDLTRADYDAIVGGPARETIPRFIKAAGLDPVTLPSVAELHAEKKQALAAILRDGALEPLPAAALFREALGRRKTAVVTSGNREGATAILGALGLLEELDALVSGDDVVNGKPHPEPFLKAAELVGVAPPDCLVLEDHPAGIAAAEAAGMTVMDVRELPARGGWSW
jgi:HAD superfamily hydrolase (TIGR01509 family)